jgi:hypothetical protein
MKFIHRQPYPKGAFDKVSTRVSEIEIVQSFLIYLFLVYPSRALLGSSRISHAVESQLSRPTDLKQRL